LQEKKETLEFSPFFLLFIYFCYAAVDKKKNGAMRQWCYAAVDHFFGVMRIARFFFGPFSIAPF
jgi:hypothetical protein